MIGNQLLPPRLWQSLLLPSMSRSPLWMWGERRQKSIYKVRLKHLISAQHKFVLGKANNGCLVFLLRLDSAALLLATWSLWYLRLGTLCKRSHQKALIARINVSIKSRSSVTVYRVQSSTATFNWWAFSTIIVFFLGNVERVLFLSIHCFYKKGLLLKCLWVTV